MEYRELLRACHADRHGTTEWDRAFKGLILHGIIAIEGTGAKGDPVKVKVLVKRDVEEEDL